MTGRVRTYEFAVFPLGRHPLSAKEIRDLEAIAIFSERFSKPDAAMEQAKAIESAFFDNVCVVASFDDGRRRRNIGLSTPKEFVGTACDAFGVNQ